MGGVLSHVAIGLLSAAIIHLIHYKLEFSAATFIGNILPDTLKFGLSGIINGTINLAMIVKSGSYTTIQPLAEGASAWFTIGFFIFATTIFLYHYHIIKKKRMEEYDELFIFLIIGVILHLLLDFFYQEPSPWL